ncbi:probable WRKY transcription factor 53 [Phtheirospermum japonicum]|uniref:Probable WRKY transcription factor 53 n=1 Tax=Phtheirospermum japonicum TaxID=374723 RepID=A0A830B7S9_9LAMI|nr:probable WRKY transcription factor 53 [Phtheirospermum japonicum]
MATQLQNHLNVPSSSRENCEYLLHKILYSYDQALSMIKHRRPGGGGASGEALMSAPGILPAANQDSPLSLASDESDQDVKDHASRKREGVAKWTQKVKVYQETGIEGQLDDGYYWRKGYYRCSHRHGQGCLATKQVQRSDEDPTIFEIKYRRKHTCTTRASPNPSIALPDPQTMDPIPLSQNPQEPSFNIQTSLGVITQGLGHNENPFSIPSSPTINPENNNIFSDCDNILGNYSTNILSPVTSGSNYFTSDNYGGFMQNYDTLDSELTPVVAGISSTTTPPTLGTHYPFGSSEFGSDFSFDNQGYFP